MPSGSRSTSSLDRSTNSQSTTTTGNGSDSSSRSSSYSANDIETENQYPMLPSSTLRQISSSSLNSTASEKGSLRRVQLNSVLSFEQPDVSWIDVPSGAKQVLRRVVADYDKYPEGRYRIIDYFRAAVEMFITQVRLEYTQQHKQAQKNGRQTRFTWRNKGELAICFAACCDMLKLLYDRLRPGPDRPRWEMLIGQFILFLMAESRIPPTVLTEQTYNTKFLDWRKGGTRYQGEQLTSNVRFPSAEERRLKIETYLRTGIGYSIESTVVETPVSHTNVRRTVTTSSSGTGSSSTVISAGVENVTVVAVANTTTSSNITKTSTTTTSTTVGHPIPPLHMLPRGQPPVKAPTKLNMKTPPPLIAGKQLVDESRHLQWLSKLTQIIGSSQTLVFPEERSNMLLAFILFCETSEIPDHFVIIANILVNSSVKIQESFEKNGGIVVLRRFVGTLVRLRDAARLINLVDRILRMKLSAWSHTSQQSWLRDTMGNDFNDLRWLRALDFIPSDKHAAWSAILSSLERRYVLAASREEKLDRCVKRSRLDAEEALHLSLADDAGVHQPVPYISTALCAKLPVEFRAPPLSSNMEQNVISFLNKKMRFCEESQDAWRALVLQALDGRFPGMPIPLWYDPYQLLGVDFYSST